MVFSLHSCDTDSHRAIHFPKQVKSRLGFLCFNNRFGFVGTSGDSRWKETKGRQEE